MKHVLKVSRRLNVTSEALTSPPVWISDALFSETFERFSRGCRRHGSHVPGPLESRRRAARRKNTSIAYSGGLPTPIEIPALFGPGAQAGWWKQEPPQKPEYDLGGPLELPEVQRPKYTRRLERKEPLPSPLVSWFRKPPPQTPPSNVEVQSPPASQESPLLSEVELETRRNAFAKDLLRAHNLADVKVFVQQLKLDFPQKRELTDLACKRVLELRLGPDALKEYILDSACSSPASKTLHFLTTQLRGKWLAHETRFEVFEIICQCVSLGVATIEDVKYMITNVPNFQMPDGADLKLLRGKDFIHDVYGRILSAVEESKVISVSDLGNHFLEAWFRDISENLSSPAATLLLWRLGCILEKPKKALACKILTESVNYDLGQDLNKVHNISLLRFLEEVPTPLLPQTLIQTTHALVGVPNKNTEKDHASILRWHDFLANMNRKTVVRAFAQVPPSVWQEALSDPGPSDERAKRAIIACWVTASMSKSHRNTVQHLRKLGLRKIFRDIYSGNNGSESHDVLAQVLVTLQSLPLPNTNLLLGNLRFITNDYLVFRNRKFAQEVAEQNLARRFAVLEHDADYDSFRDHFSDALVELAESVNQNLPQFLHIARTFVEKDEAAFRIVTRILKHNLAFHNALSQASPQREARDGNDTWRTVPGAQKLPRVEPRQALDFMNHLAVYFASSPVIGPRQALRRVYWCFSTIHRYGGPIETPIIRALWHAGVTRYHQAGRGAANTVLRWIVKQVQIVEGEKVADMLLRSNGFRRKMQQQFKDLQWLHGDKLPAEIDGFQWLDPNNVPVKVNARLKPNMQTEALEHDQARWNSFPSNHPVKGKMWPKFSKERLLNRANFNREAMKIRLLRKEIRSLDQRLRHIVHGSSQ